MHCWMLALLSSCCLLKCVAAGGPPHLASSSRARVGCADDFGYSREHCGLLALDGAMELSDLTMLSDSFDIFEDPACADIFP
jgi:hypothetical protein